MCRAPLPRAAVALLSLTRLAPTCPACCVSRPQYPLYSASIQLYGGTLLPYSLKEEAGWSMDLNEITRTVHDAR